MSTHENIRKSLSIKNDASSVFVATHPKIASTEINKVNIIDISWVTKWSKILKKLRECVFLTVKYNLEIFLEIRLLTMKTEQKTGNFSFFHVVTMCLTFFPNSFFTKRYIMYQFNKFSTSLLKKDTVIINSRVIRFFLDQRRCRHNSRHGGRRKFLIRFLKSFLKVKICPWANFQKINPAIKNKFLWSGTYI